MMKSVTPTAYEDPPQSSAARATGGKSQAPTARSRRTSASTFTMCAPWSGGSFRHRRRSSSSRIRCRSRCRTLRSRSRAPCAPRRPLASSTNASSSNLETRNRGYVGEIGTFKGDWFGVELDEPVGNCDGATVGGVYRGRCAKNHGIYIRPAPSGLSLSLSRQCSPRRSPRTRRPRPRPLSPRSGQGRRARRRVRAELAAEKELREQRRPRADDRRRRAPMPTGGPPAESAP